MAKDRIVETDEEGQYDLSNVEQKRENADIKRVKEGMAKLTADLALIENGIAVKRKREDVDKQVGFNLKNNQMHVIPCNVDKKVDQSKTVYSPIIPETIERKNNSYNYVEHNRNGNRNHNWTWSQNENNGRNDCYNSRNNRYNNNTWNNNRYGPMAKEAPPPYTPKSPVYCDVNGEPKIDQRKIDIEPKLEKNKIDGWGNKSPDGEKSGWLYVSNAAKS